MLRAAHVFACLSLAVVSSLTVPTLARACGCVSPPIPDGVGEFAVNQQAEQIIFEVGAGTVSAHVLVRFAGAPEEFAWIVPVPNVVDVELSESLMFPILDQLTAPRIAVVARDVCPDPEFVCDHHPALHCGDDDEGGDGDGDDDGDKDSGGGDGGDSEDPDGIDIDLKKQIGAYDIVAFGADEAGKAVAWLQDNGFIVNDSMTPFMEPYVALGMHFVAAKLIPGADVQEIRPLKLTYEGEHPMIPLRLTAVAAEPHMPVMAWIYGETSYGPMVKPLITLDAAGLAADTDGNNNYGSLVARSIADSGDAAFVAEYSGRPPTPDFNQDSYCCDYGGDYCGIADDSICQCPKTDFDHADCAAIEGLLESITALEGLAASHAHVTRLLTMASPEHMDFDPMFLPSILESPVGALGLVGKSVSLDGCRSNVIDKVALKAIDARAECATMYCGTGTCGWTADDRTGCSCAKGSTARSYRTLEGRTSVTCVPEIGTVDLGIGIELPDVCAAIDCGAGSCLAVGGFPTCSCALGDVAVLEKGQLRCKASVGTTGDSGARNYTSAYEDVKICSPRPEYCGPQGWLVPNKRIGIHGIACSSTQPDPADFVVPNKWTCEGDSDTQGPSGTGGIDTDDGLDSTPTSDGEPTIVDFGGSSCRSTSEAAPFGLALMLLTWLGAFGLRGRAHGTRRAGR